MAILIGLTGLGACKAPRGPLDVGAAGEHSRIVRIFDGVALILDIGQRVQIVGIGAPARRPGARTAAASGARGHLADPQWLQPAPTMQESALVLVIQKAAAELCQLPEGTLARGFLRDGRLEISHPLNLEKLEN